MRAGAVSTGAVSGSPHAARHSHSASQSGFHHHSPSSPAGSRQVGIARVAQHSRSASGTTQTAMQLSTACDNCGERVSVDVPRWMTDAIEHRSNQPEHDRLVAPPMSRSASSGSRIGSGREWRDAIVAGAISLAQAVKQSPIPPLVVALVKTLFTFAVYVNTRFQLHQKLAVVLVAVLEGLVEIEREVGLLRKGGEGLSVLWEAFVRGTIALAKSEPYPPHPAQQYQHQQHANLDHPHPHSYPGTPPFRPHPHQQPEAGSPYLAGHPQPFSYSTQNHDNLDGHDYDDLPSDFELDGHHHYGRSHPGPSRQTSPHFLAVDAAEGVRRRPLRRTAFSSPSLPRLENGDRPTIPLNDNEAKQYPFPPSYDQAGAAGIGTAIASSYYNPRPPRQRSRSEHSSETITMARADNTAREQPRGRQAASGPSSPSREEKRASWMGRVVAGAAGRIGSAR